MLNPWPDRLALPLSAVDMIWSDTIEPGCSSMYNAAEITVDSTKWSLRF